LFAGSGELEAGVQAGDIVPRREIGGELDESVVVRIAFDAEERAGSLTA